MGTVPAVLLRPIPAAIVLVLLGVAGAAVSVFLLAPAVRAARGEGVTGTFTLVQPGPCARDPLPRRRCVWFGDFRGDDGRTVRRDVELDPRLPLTARAGDTVPARDTGAHRLVYARDAAGSWRMPALGLGVFGAMILTGIAVSQPWSWRKWIRRRREIGRHRS
jgi:hypothetical protein